MALAVVVGLGALALNWDREPQASRNLRNPATAQVDKESSAAATKPLADHPRTPVESAPAEVAVRTEARALAQAIRLKERGRTLAKRKFEAGMISREELLLIILDADLDRAAALLFDPRGLSPLSEIETTSAELQRVYSRLFEAGALAAPAHRDGVAALKALRLTFRWFESPMGRMSSPVSVEPSATASPDAEREYLEAALTRLKHREDAVANLQRLLVEARLGERESEEAHESAKRVAAEASQSLPTARQDDLDALLALFDWYRFAKARRVALR